MTSRNKRANKRSMDTGQTQAMSLEQYMGQTLGDWESIRSPHKHMNASPISIFEIVPDQSQPRRAIPSTVRYTWYAQITANTSIENQMVLLFEVWETLANAERQEHGIDAEFDLMAYLGQESAEERIDEESGYDASNRPIESALVKVTDIALSIRKFGLNNPITVVPRMPKGYIIETGERRWLAYHLLYAKGLATQQENIDDNFSTISARKVDRISVWRQAAENGARDDLNAIAKARQIAVLLMDQHSAMNGKEFEDFDAFEDLHEREFYAQVYDPERNRFLRAINGTQESIIAAVGLKSGRQMSQYRKLLTLPNEAWEIADDYNISEYALRDIVDNKALTDEERIIAVKQLLTRSEREMTLSVMDEPKNAEIAITERSEQPPEHHVNIRKYFSTAARVFSQIDEGNPHANMRAWEYLEKMRGYLSEIENRLLEIEQSDSNNT